MSIDTETTGTWREAGAAWGERAADWAYLLEPGFRPVYLDVLPRLGLGPGVRLLDLACGSGLAAWHAGQSGAEVEGLDAAEALLAIARRRSPQLRFTAGDMYALPYPDRSFDAGVSFNGIFGGDQRALDELARVVRRGGRVALSFWGRPRLREHFEMLITYSRFKTEDEADAEARLLEIGKAGVAEAMFEAAGIEPLERGVSTMVNEWPDLETAVRAACSAGPAWPVMQSDRADEFRAALEAALAPFAQPGLGVRVCSEIGYLVGTVR